MAQLVSEKTGITKKAAGQAQKAVIELFSSTLEKGGSISLIGFGSFKVVERAAREGRNPSTGKKIQIPASKTVKFTPSKSLSRGVPMNPEGFKRRLAAILSADVEGYSILMREDEEWTIRTITEYRKAVATLIESYRGRVVDSPGDNLLAEFTSVVDAVNCAVEVQRELAERNAELSGERKMQFRIGVNIGDVIEEGERIYGDGVNVAARMESLSDGGGVCISYWIGCAQHLSCEFEKADINIGRAEKVTRAANIRWRESTMKSLLSHLVYYYQGRIHLAHETSSEAVRIADDSGDIFSKTFAYSCHGISCFGKGSFQEAIEFLSIGRESSEKLNQYWWKPWSNHFLGEVYFEIGEYQKATDHYAKAVSFFDHYGNWPSTTIVSKIGLARAKTMNNQEDFNLEALYAYVSENKAKLYEGWIRRYVAEVLLNRDEDITSEAEDWIRAAIAADDKNRVLFELGRDYLVYAAILKGKGDQPREKENLSKSIEIFKECGADGWVAKYEKELGTLS